MIYQPKTDWVGSRFFGDEFVLSQSGVLVLLGIDGDGNHESEVLDLNPVEGWDRLDDLLIQLAHHHPNLPLDCRDWYKSERDRGI